MAKLSESFYLSFYIMINFIITYYVAGIEATLWSSLATLHSYTIFNKASRYRNIKYSLLCSAFIFIASALGYYIGVGLLFFVILFISPLFYYQFYNIDSSLDMSIKYSMIFFIIGSTLSKSGFDGYIIGLLIGTLVTLLLCYSLSDRKRISLFQIKKYLSLKKNKMDFNLLSQSLVYATGLLACVLSSRAINVDHFFWAPLTFIFVLNPQLKNIVSLTRDRVIGTLIVVLILYFSFNASALMPYIGFGLILLFSFLIPVSNKKKNNVFGTVCLTGLVLSLIEMSIYFNNTDYHLLSERILETLIGGIFAILSGYCIKLIMKDDIFEQHKEHEKK